jgi:outer membrane protein OmpA-like peptidoglycan-associated protein
LSIANVNFATGSFALTSQSRALLDTAAKTIVSGGYTTINLAGYTDSRGSATANLRLSRDRALAVQKYLTTKLGSFDASFNISYFGMAKPVAAGNSSSALAANRRVEIFVSN